MTYSVQQDLQCDHRGILTEFPVFPFADGEGPESGRSTAKLIISQGSTLPRAEDTNCRKLSRLS